MHHASVNKFPYNFGGWPLNSGVPIVNREKTVGTEQFI